MTAHAFLPPSGASTWSECAMWPTMNDRYPQEGSEESAEGDAAHWVGTELWAGRAHPVGTQTPNNLIVTEEMIEGAELLCDTLRTRMGNLTVYVEEKISIAVIHPSCFGTPDYWAHTGHSKRIEIVDYKFGHRFVGEYFNAQGLCYLAGILAEAFGQVDKLDPDITVSFTIVQPRCYHKGQPVRTHTFKLIECQPFMRKLKAMAEAAFAPQPEATTNDGCCYCPGRHSCSTLQQAAYSDAEFSTDRLPLELSPAATALELKMLSRALARLEARVDGLKEQTLVNIKRGENVPYYRIQEGKGRAQWNLPVEQVVAMGDMFGVDLRKPALVTPVAAAKLGIDSSVITAYSTSNSTGLKLVEDDAADARRVFGAQEAP